MTHRLVTMEQSSISPPCTVGTAQAVFLSAWHFPSPSTLQRGRKKSRTWGQAHTVTLPSLGVQPACGEEHTPQLTPEGWSQPAEGAGLTALPRHFEGRGYGQADMTVAHTYLVSLRAVLTTPLCQNCPWLNSTAVTGVPGGELHILTHIL